MLKLDIIVNDSELIQIQSNGQIRMEDIANKIISIFQFPKESQYVIEIDKKKQEPSDVINVQPQTKIKAKFKYETKINFIDKQRTTFEHKIDLCKKIIEIQQEIMRVVLPIEYSVQIKQQIDNNNNLYLNSYQEIPKELQFDIWANFYINYEGKHWQFKIDPHENIDFIKTSVIEIYDISGFSLFYNEIELNDQKQYITYLIPDHSELKIQFCQRREYKIQYEGTIRQYSCSCHEKLDIIKQKLKQIYQIPERASFQLMYQNTIIGNDKAFQDILIKELSAPITMKVYIEYQLQLQDRDSQQQYQLQVKSTDQISILDTQNWFKYQQVSYYYNGQKLIKTQTFEQLKLTAQIIIIHYQIEMYNQKINVYFQDQNKRKTKIEVMKTDIINNALLQFNQANDLIGISYRGKNISIETTYEQEQIEDESIIDYKINNAYQIKYIIPPNIEENIISVSRNTNGSQLLKILSQNHQNLGYKYKLMVNDQEFPSNQLVTQNQCFRLVGLFEVEFKQQNDDQIYLETFQLEDKILDARQKLAQKFNKVLDSITLKYQDIQLKDDQLIHYYKDKQLCIYQTVLVKFQKKNTTSGLSFPKIYNQNIQLKDIIKEFLKNSNQNSGRFEFDQQLVDENLLLKELCEDQYQIILFYEFEQNLTLKNKEQLTETYRVQFYQKEIVGTILSKYISDNFQCYYHDQLIDFNKSFEDNKIQNNSEILFNKIYYFTLQILNDKSNISLQINSLNVKIEDIISPKIKQKYSENFNAYYHNRQIDLQKTFLQERIGNDAVIQIDLILIVIVYENDHQKEFKVDPTMNIGVFIQQLDSMQQQIDSLEKKNKKLYNILDQRYLEDNILLSTLKDFDNKVKLVYKEVISDTFDDIHQPSEIIQEQYIQITILNMINDEKLYETVRVDQKIGDFLIDFQNKMEFSGISLFYEGAEVDFNKTFEEIGTKSQSLFEII